jgi:hypothetical protein
MVCRSANGAQTMSNDHAFTETELAQRWNISVKTLQRWRSESRGPRYYKLSKAVRYALEDVLAYEDAQRQGMPIGADPPVAPSPPPIEPSAPTPAVVEPKRYTLREAFDLVCRHGSLEAAEASMREVSNDLQR